MTLYQVFNLMYFSKDLKKLVSEPEYKALLDLDEPDEEQKQKLEKVLDKLDGVIGDHRKGDLYELDQEVDSKIDFILGIINVDKWLAAYKLSSATPFKVLKRCIDRLKIESDKSIPKDSAGDVIKELTDFLTKKNISDKDLKRLESWREGELGACSLITLHEIILAGLQAHDFEAVGAAIKYASKKILGHTTHKCVKHWRNLLRIAQDKYFSDFEKTIQWLGKFDLYRLVSIQIYPKGGFDGDEALGEMRDLLDAAAEHLTHLAGSLVGVPLCSAYYVFDKVPYHRFQVSSTETYHRSARNPLSMLLKDTVVYGDPKPRVAAAHQGRYYNPLQALETYFFEDKKNILKSLKCMEPPLLSPVEDPKNLYDLNLNYRARLIEQIKADFSGKHFTFFTLTGYPCFQIAPCMKISESRATREAFSEMLASVLIALTNRIAHKEGIYLELTRRSSFGHLTPTIAICGQAIRINIGLVPEGYARVLKKAILYLDALLPKILASLHALKIEKPEGDKSDYVFHNVHYQTYNKTTCETLNEEKGVSLYDFLLAKLEVNNHRNPGKSTIAHMMRKAETRQQLMMRLYSDLTIDHDADADSALVGVLLNNFSKCIKTNGSKLYLALPTLEKPSLKYSISPTSRKDADFLEVIKKIIDNVRARAERFMPTLSDDGFDESKAELAGTFYRTWTQTLESLDKLCASGLICIGNTDQGLYYQLLKLNELLFVMANLSRSLSRGCRENGFGSDSEEEGLCDLRIYAKKIIVQNGMRALLSPLLAYAMMFPDLEGKILSIEGAYYELKKNKEFLEKKGYTLTDSVAEAEIVLYDLNPCITSSEDDFYRAEDDSDREEDDSDIKKDFFDIKSATSAKMFVLDVTSAQMKEMASSVKYLFKNFNPTLIVLVSSDLKNAQLGLDKNAYGTVRVFARDKSHLDLFVKTLRRIEEPLGSDSSHRTRRLMKRLGATPRNATILAKMRVPKDDSPPVMPDAVV